MDDISGNLKHLLDNNPIITGLFRDRIIDWFKKLSLAEDFLETDRAKLAHQFNTHKLLHSLLFKKYKAL